MDMSETLAPKSDQLDAQDLMTGPRDVTVKSVGRGPSEEQPINFYLEEADRPWRPTKTVRNLIVAAWGKETVAYHGRRLRIFRDPEVMFGGMAVGGIRVSHMSHLPGGKTFKAVIMVARGKFREFTVDPLPDVAPQGGATSGDPMTDKTRGRLFALLTEAGITDPEEQRARMTKLLRRKVESRSELTETDGRRVITAVEKLVKSKPAPAPEPEPENEPDPNFPPNED